jgi:LPS export ABC transporter protein LptC
VKLFYLRAAAVLAALVIVGLLISRLGGRIDTDGVLDFSIRAEQLPQIVQRIRNFHRVVTRDGKKLLELSAAEASYFKDDTAVIVISPRIIFFENGEEFATLSSDQARLYIEGNEVNAAEMQGTVDVRLEQFRLTAEDMTFETTQRLLLSQGFVEIESPEIKLSGTGFTLYLAEKRLNLASDVKVRVSKAPVTRVSELR